MVFEPQYTAYREMTTKLTCMATLIDDVYDVYGTLEELELLTDYIVRFVQYDYRIIFPYYYYCLEKDRELISL